MTEIEEKVSTQQSVGAEVANARRVDRPLREGKLDESDKSLARSLRAPGKKRKKKRPEAGRRIPVWFRAALIVAALAAIVGFFTYVMWPEGMDAAYARVQSAGPDERSDAAAKFLNRFHGDPDPRVAEVRDLFKAEKVRAEEETLSRRHAREHMRNNPEGYDEEAYRSAMLAIGAEAVGQLPQAAAQWNVVREKSPAADPGAIASVESKSVLGWVAEKRLRDIQGVRDAAPAPPRADRRKTGPSKRPDLRQPEQPGADRHACSAARTIGHAESEVAVAGPREADREGVRPAGLVSARESRARGLPRRRTGTTRSPAEPLEARERQTGEGLGRGPGRPRGRVPRRDIRNGCRDIIALYDDETSEPIQAIVARARKLLEYRSLRSPRAIRAARRRSPRKSR